MVGIVGWRDAVIRVSSVCALFGRGVGESGKRMLALGKRISRIFYR